MSNESKSLWSRSAVFRFFCYLPVGYVVAWFVVAFCYEVLGWEWLEFIYEKPSNKSVFLFRLIGIAPGFSAMWVWRKPLVIKPVKLVVAWLDKNKPVKSVVTWLDKKAEE